MEEIYVCKTDQVCTNSLKAFDVDGSMKVLIINSDDDYYAYQAVCPHQDVSLEEGIFDGEVLTCHQHLWQWEIKNNGKPIGMAECPLEQYTIITKEDEIYIKLPNALQSCIIFSDVDQEILENVFNTCNKETYETGDIIYSIGDPSNKIFILESGHVEFKLGHDNRIVDAGYIQKKGELFGWSSLINFGSERLATAISVSHTTAYCIDGHALIEILDNSPDAGYSVMKRLNKLISKFMYQYGPK